MTFTWKPIENKESGFDVRIKLNELGVVVEEIYTDFQPAALEELTAKIDNHINDKANPHQITKAQIGLSNVANLMPQDYPISTATQEALNLKASISALALAASDGNLGFQQIGAGSVFRTLLDKLREVVTPEDFGAKGDGVTDDTLAFTQLTAKLTASGGAVNFKAGSVYLISSSFVLPSNVIIFGNKATLLLRTWANWTPFIHDYGSALNNKLYFGIRNLNWSYTTQLDKNIYIQDVVFKCQTTSTTIGGISSWNGHGINLAGFVNAQVSGCEFYRIADCTAMLYSKGAGIVTGNYGEDANNCAWDLWAAVENPVISFNTDVNCQTSTNLNNILFDSTDIFVSQNLLYTGNTSKFAFNAAIFIAPLGPLRQVKNVKIINNTFIGDGVDHSGGGVGLTMVPIVFQGVEGGCISGNTFKSYGNGPLVTVLPAIYSPSPAQPCKNISIHTNFVDSCASAGQYWFDLKGDNIQMYGNFSISSTGYGQLRMNSPNGFIGINFFSGTTFTYVFSDQQTGDPVTPPGAMLLDPVTGFSLNKPLGADFYGKIMVAYNSVDYIKPDVAGSTLLLTPDGTSPNVGIQIRAKGTGIASLRGDSVSLVSNGTGGIGMTINGVGGYGFSQFGCAIPTGRNYAVNNLQVVTDRKTGWTPATGTPTRTTFDTSSVTLPQLAERVKALIDDLHFSSGGHGLLGN